MKKLLVIISMLAVAISCETMYGPVQTPIAADKAEGIAITVNSVDDNSASFTLAPAGECSYYSYLVDESDKAVALDSSLLYSCKYASVAQGTVKWAEDAATKTVELTELLPNTTYQIYAVAGSPMGFVSSVVTTSFKTSDKVAPVLDEEAWEIADNVVTLTFSEDVLVGAGAITANYYAYNDPDFAEAKPVGIVTADAQKIAVEGNVVTIEFDGLPQGAFYAVNYPEGTFKDASNNLVAALESAMMLDAESWETMGKGVYGQRDLGTYELIAPETTAIANWDDPFILQFGSEYGYGYTLRAATGSVIYEHAGKSTAIELVSGTHFAYVSAVQALVVMLPEEPQRGDKVTITIAAGSFEDYYGNLNEEWTLTANYVFDYTIADVLGAYQAQYFSAFEGDYMPMNLKIEAVTEEDMASMGYIKGCNVKFTELLVPTMVPIYAYFDPLMGTLTVPSYQTFFQMKEGETMIILGFMTLTGGSPDPTTPTVFNMPESGVLTCDTMFGILKFDAATGQSVSWYDVSQQCFAEKVTDAAAVAPMSFPSEFKHYPLDSELLKK